MQYGSIRVRAQLPIASGVWPAIWALGSDNLTAGFPWSGEIDLAELVGSQPSTVFQTIHGPAYTGGQYALSTHTTLNSPAEHFHVYGVDWTPQGLTFSIDGRATASFTRAEIEKQGTWVFDKPFFLLLDVAVGGTFPGPPDDPGAYPQSMVLDYVRVYRDGAA